MYQREKEGDQKFNQLLNAYRSKRNVWGVECLYEFEYKTLYRQFEVYDYFCKLCHELLQADDAAYHCASYIHLFRYVGKYYPNEYKRLSDNLDTSDIIVHFEIMMVTLEKKFILPSASPIKQTLQSNSRPHFNAYINDLKNASPIIVIISSKLEKDLIALNNAAENRYIDEQRNQETRMILDDIKRTQSPPQGSFLRGFLEQNELDDDLHNSHNNHIIQQQNSQQSSNKRVLLDDNFENNQNLSHPVEMLIKENENEEENMDENLANLLCTTVKELIEGNLDYMNADSVELIEKHSDYISNMLKDDEHKSDKLTEVMSNYYDQIAKKEELENENFVQDECPGLCGQYEPNYDSNSSNED